MLKIENRSSLAVLIPVQLDKKSRLKFGQIVEVKSKDLKIISLAKIVKISNEVHTVANNQFVLVTALLNENTIPSGSVVDCKIQCGNEQIFKNLVKSFKEVEIN